MKNLFVSFCLLIAGAVSAQGSFNRQGQTWYFDTVGHGAWYTGDGKDYYGTDAASSPSPAYVQGGVITGKAISKEAWERGLPAAWARGFTGAGIRVAVLDSGCDTSAYLQIAGGRNFTGGNPADYSDGFGHGTARCGQIVGRPVNGTGITGNAPGATLFALKIIDNTGYSTPGWCSAALNWCDSAGIDIIVCAFQFADNSTQPLFDKLSRKGAWIVCSAGNQEMNNPATAISSPAAFRSTIAVGGIIGGGVAKKDATRYAANSRLPVAGKGITFNTYIVGLCHFKDGTFGSEFGTSYAGPSEAGFLAVYRQWLRSKGIDFLAYQAIADLQRRWSDRVPDGSCFPGSMDFIK